MIQRKIDTRLDAFFASRQGKALLLTGARQTGKTYSLRRLGERRFAHHLEINFVESPEARHIFEGASDAREVLLRLSAFATTPLVKGETLIFLDEVQECPEAVTMIKFLVDEGSFRYALSGSLLGVALKDLRSEPVGYIDVWELCPLDFEEFALAVGVAPHILQSLRDCAGRLKPVDAFVHSRMLALFRLYLLVGGMPAAVARYLESNDLQQVADEQRAILTLYKRDVARYDPSRKLLLDEILTLIPSELDAKNKRFILKDLNEHLKFQRFENSFLWLKEAGVALPTYNVEEPKVPLLLSELRSLFKLFQNDVGLLASQYAKGLQLSLLQDETTMNYGAVYENAVAQELHAQGFELRYYNSKRLGEVDFLVEYEGHPLPIEVKSGKDFTRHRAMSNLLADAQYDIPRAIVLCAGNVATDAADARIVYLPIYMTTFIHRPQATAQVHPFDLTGLK